MSKKISDSLNAEIAKAEGYRKKAYSDLVTNLENRQGFDLQFNHLLSANDNFSSAALLVIEIDGLKDFNRDFGFLEGDAMLVAVAQIIQYGSEPNGRMVSRIGGAAFALVVVDMAVSLVELFADEIRHRLSKYFDTIDPGKILVFSIGCVEFTAQQNRGEIFAKVDFALETARTSGTRNTAFMKFGDPSIPMEGSISWRNVIQRALSEKRWALFAQPVLALGNGTLVQHEIFARLEDKSGNLVAASNFLPMALRHQLMPEIDKVVITLTIDMLAAPMDHFQDVSINISIQSITNQQFCTWLIEKLQASRQFCARLCVELSEFGCLTDLTATQNFIRMLKNLQVRFGIDHFGIDPRSMELLRQVPPDYIKLEGGLITALSDDEKNIDHLKSLVALAKSLDISVIAHNIESQKIRDLLIDNNVEFGQGFLLGAPVQVSSSYN